MSLTRWMMKIKYSKKRFQRFQTATVFLSLSFSLLLYSIRYLRSVTQHDEYGDACEKTKKR